MKSARVWTVAALLLVTAAVAQAEEKKKAAKPKPAKSQTLKIADAGVVVAVPATWRLESEGSITAKAPEDKGVVYFIVAESSAVQQALQQVEEQLNRMATDVQAGNSEEGKINGLDVVSSAGTCKIDGVGVNLRIALVSNADKKVLIMLALVRSDAGETIDRQTIEMFQSIKPLK